MKSYGSFSEKFFLVFISYLLYLLVRSIMYSFYRKKPTRSHLITSDDPALSISMNHHLTLVKGVFFAHLMLWNKACLELCCLELFAPDRVSKAN